MELTVPQERDPPFYQQSQTSVRQYLPRTAGSRWNHLPFVKSGIATGMLPMATESSLRQVTAIHAAVS